MSVIAASAETKIKWDGKPLAPDTYAAHWLRFKSNRRVIPAIWRPENESWSVSYGELLTPKEAASTFEYAGMCPVPHGEELA